MKITNIQIHEAYLQGKRVYAGEISLADAKAIVAQKTGMNEGSAHGYMNTFLKIMEGTGYTRTINAYGTDYYLKNIKYDFGTEILLTAISSVKKHLEYYKGVGKSSQPAIHKILNLHIKELESNTTLNEIFSNFNKQVELSLADNSETRKSRLKAATSKPNEIQVTTKVYVRNPDVVAEALNRANGVCENCSKSAPFKRAKDGTPYLEVHHKINLAKGGKDTVENTLALCPNCHREFHYGVTFQKNT